MALTKNKRQVNVYSKRTIIKIIKKVCTEYSTGLYTLENVCLNAGVPYRTFKDWWSRYYRDPNNTENKWCFLAEVAGLWEASKTEKNDNKREELIKLAETMLRKRLMGYITETSITRFKKTIDKDGTEFFKPVGMTKITKERPPSATLIMFVLERLKPEVYGKRIVFVNVNQPNDYYKGRTLAEIQAEIAELEREYIKDEMKN